LERWCRIAAIVIRNKDSSVAAYVGGTDVAANVRGGYVDLVQAIRSPGSALKPFVYAMAFEKLVVHPDTIVTDRSVEIGGYRPENADGVFAGDMSIRQALIRSRNTIPARRRGASNARIVRCRIVW
jgi:penicillin-binding protein 1C